MAQTATHEHTVAQQESEIAELQQLLRASKQQLEENKRLVVHSERKIHALKNLNAGLLSQIDASHAYALACENLVFCLQASSALVITTHEERHQIAGAYRITEGQRALFYRDHLSTSAWTLLCNSGTGVSSATCTGTTGLALRVLFGCDDLIAVPITFAGQTSAYLVVLFNGHKNTSSSYDDQSFLQTIANLVGQSVEAGNAFLALERQNQRLHELDELKDAFISIASHQLRTPLSIVKWILALLEDEPILQGEERVLDLLKQAMVGNERLIRIVNDLLNVSRAEEGKLPYSPQNVDVQSLVQELVTHNTLAATQHSLTLNYSYFGKNKTVTADPLLLSSAVQNVLDNAFSYADADTVVTLEVTQDDRLTQIAISDQGMPITPSDEQKIYTQFYRSPEAVRREPNGNGLGLYLTQAIIKQHNGGITISNHENIVTFTLSF